VDTKHLNVNNVFGDILGKLHDFGQIVKAKNNIMLPILNERVLRFDDLRVDFEVSSFSNRWTY
jgi:hypothetical protein